MVRRDDTRRHAVVALACGLYSTLSSSSTIISLETQAAAAAISILMAIMRLDGGLIRAPALEFIRWLAVESVKRYFDPIERW